MKVFALLLSVLLLASCSNLHIYWDRSGEVVPAENSLLSAEEEVSEPAAETPAEYHHVPLYDFSWIESVDWEAYRASNPNLAQVEVVENLEEEKTEEPPVQEEKRALGLTGDQMVTIAICIVISLIVFTVSYNNGYRRRYHRHDDDD